MNESDKPEKKAKPLNQRQLADTLIAEERLKAMAAGFTPEPSGEWRLTKDWWVKASEDERKDMLYSLSRDSSAKPKTIAKYYSIEVADLNPSETAASCVTPTADRNTSASATPNDWPRLASSRL